MTSHRDDLKDRIREARQTAGLTLDTLGEMVGSSRRHMIRLEQGENSPKDGLLERIAVATGRPMSFFNGNHRRAR